MFIKLTAQCPALPPCLRVNSAFSPYLCSHPFGGRTSHSGLNEDKLVSISLSPVFLLSPSLSKTPRSSEKVFKKMTNQNVLMSDAESVICMAIRVAMGESNLFPPAVPKSLPRFISMPQKKFLKRIETYGREEGAGKVNAWVDSMRASSPTRNGKSTPLLETEEKNSNWIVNHPSALNMFDRIKEASKGKQVVMFLDYDGTLSPIVEDPDRAFMSKEMRAAVRAAARYFPTAIVTGRCIEKVYEFVRLEELYYAGSHGMDIKGPPKSCKFSKGNEAVLCQPATEFLPMINEVYETLVEKTSFIPGAKVEHNKFCVSVHFRCVDEKNWATLAEQVRSVLNHYPKLRHSQGRKVLEIRPTIKWDKGRAIEFLLDTLGFGNSNNIFPIYIGDDRTDEDAFKVLRKRGQGFGVLVSKTPKDTHAAYTLQEPSEVKDFLKRLVQWKRSTLQQKCHQ